jgi:FkbM family methyltransferase
MGIFEKILDYLIFNKYGKPSFSQSGEDVIVDFIFSNRGKSNPTYIDVGAHHPYFLSNTAFFYRKGCCGVNIEPDPILFVQLNKDRNRDINLNVGIGVEKGFQDFYVMDSPTMNTFSKHEAEKLAHEHNMPIRKVISVPVDTLTNVINKYCQQTFPDFLSLDIEGLDFDVLQTIDYKKTAPIVICIETISYSPIGKGEKDVRINDLLLDNSYMLYADTNINSIFVKRSFWEK